MFSSSETMILSSGRRDPQHRRRCRRVGKVFTHSVAGTGIACQHKGAVDGVRVQEAVNDLQCSEHSACSIGNGQPVGPSMSRISL